MESWQFQGQHDRREVNHVRECYLDKSFLVRCSPVSSGNSDGTVVSSGILVAAIFDARMEINKNPDIVYQRGYVDFYQRVTSMDFHESDSIFVSA